MAAVRAGWGCALLAAVLCIGYDTSAATAPLEDGHAHLSFGMFLALTGVGGAIGMLVGAVVMAVAVTRDAAEPEQ